ncbi:hypothetical protein U14_04132 [Candidatus Moduliflexus flocculans]|uniref:Uncharacterized protein n=1 Tax=Candidatus Moduliflexus flocculans TaxID=1499966 RepID=A0A0S6W3B8_9BACT|nr:hypothetical protein U14_04132 [Candidatus Moduliflexus flocculans]
MEDRKEYLFKETAMIQDIIKRMASNSFMIKGWTLTLVVATLLLKGENKYQVLIAYIPLLVFWFLDAYFLQQERLYRKLYNWVIQNRLKSDEYILDMNAYRFKNDVQSLDRTMSSVTLAWFYGSIMGIVLLYTIILFS